MSEPKLVNDLLNETVLLVLVDLKFESRGKGESLSNREVCEKHVVLHHVGAESREGVLVDGHLVVEEDTARDARVSSQTYAVSQDIQQTRLTSSR